MGSCGGACITHSIGLGALVVAWKLIGLVRGRNKNISFLGVSIFFMGIISVYRISLKKIGLYEIDRVHIVIPCKNWFGLGEFLFFIGFGEFLIYFPFNW